MYTGSVTYKMSGGTTKPARHLQTNHPKKIHGDTLGGMKSSPIMNGMLTAANMVERYRFSQKQADDLLILWIIH
jgi:hypothetical protein